MRNTLKLVSVVVILTALGGVAVAQNGKSAIDPAYQQSFDKWKSELVDDLKENWLPLAGLFWLKLGDNPFGSDQSLAMALPAGSAPARAGVFTLNGTDVTVKFAPGVQATINGKAPTGAVLQPDVSGKADMIELGKLRMRVIARGQRIGIRVKDLDSAAVRDYKGPIFYPLSMTYHITATWVPSDGKKTVDVPNILGDITPTPLAGEAVFKLNGQELRLAALGDDPSKGLFIIFKDPTSKTETYPPGRFLDTEGVVGNTVILDFNEAHNPPCAVTPYATCPLPPKENQLAVAIPAGEKFDHKAGHH